MITRLLTILAFEQPPMTFCETCGWWYPPGHSH